MAVFVAIVVAVFVAVTVPAMVVTNLSALALPISLVEELSIMTGRHPMRAGVGWTSPVSVVPFIAVAHRVPVAIYPKIVGARTSRLNSDYTRPWGCGDSDPYGKLSDCSSCCQQDRYKQFSFHGSDPFFSRFRFTEAT